MSLVTIIDYGSGNLRSAEKALQRVSREESRADDICVTSDPDLVLKADRVILPGVGAFADCKKGLSSVPGMIDALNEVVEEKGRPFLGICVGAQLIASRGLEKNITDGLDWIEGEVRALEPADPQLKIPHMGWNTIDFEADHPVFKDIQAGDNGCHAYFVHSFHIVPVNVSHRLAITRYGGKVTAIIGRDTMIGTQFHPEKSQLLGLQLLRNFLKWTP